MPMSSASDAVKAVPASEANGTWAKDEIPNIIYYLGEKLNGHLFKEVYLLFIFLYLFTKCT